MKKLPHEMTVEDLLEIAQSSEDTQSIPEEYSDNVLGFVSAYDLQPGTEPVKINLLYRLYKKWSKEPCNRMTFSRQLSKWFVINNSFLQSNKNIFKINAELQKATENKTPSHRKRSRLKHFEYFLTQHKISPGNTYIEGYVLYSLYDRWCYQRQAKTLLKKQPFEQFCSLFFSNQKHKIEETYNIKFYGVNKEVYELFTKEQLERLRDLDPYGKKKVKEKSSKR